MTLLLTYDGTTVAHDFARSTVSITSVAEDGEAAQSGIVIEDPGSTLELLGHRPFIVEEDTCSQPRLFTGWTTERSIGRAPEDAMLTTVRRLQDVTVIDLNALFRSGSCPARTPSARRRRGRRGWRGSWRRTTSRA
jgi:hypothetical protein